MVVWDIECWVIQKGQLYTMESQEFYEGDNKNGW